MGPTSYIFARKEVRPGKKTICPPDCWDPPDGPAYFAKKMFPALSARTHRKCLLITHKKMNTPPASWDPPWWEADLWAY